MGWDADRQTIERAQADDGDALRQVLESARDPVWCLAREFVRDWDEAEVLRCTPSVVITRFRLQV